MLVNNAGIGMGAPVGEIDTKRLDMQLDINIRSIVLFYRECMPMLKAAGALHKRAIVVNTASIAGKRLHLMRSPDAVCVGGAILAVLAIGEHGSVSETVDHFVREASVRCV